MGRRGGWGGGGGVERVLKLHGCRLPFGGHQSSRTRTDDGAGLPKLKSVSTEINVWYIYNYYNYNYIIC